MDTSPEVSMPLMSSRKDDSMTCVSLKRKIVCSPFIPARSYSFLMSSRKSSAL